MRSRTVQSVVKEMSLKPGEDLAGGGPENAQSNEPNRWLMNVVLGYEDVLRSAVDWMWETDANLRLTRVSEPFTEGVKIPPQMSVGRDLSQLEDFEETGQKAPSMAEALNDRKAFRNARVTVSNLGEPSLSFRLAGVPVFDRRSGEFQGYRGTGAVQPEEAPRPVASEEANEQLIGLLERALARKDQLEWELSRSGRKSFESRIASITHELRTPLNAIIGFAEIIKRRAFGDDLERYVDYGSDIYDSGMHMVALVDSLIDLAKIERQEEQSGQQPLVVRDFISRTLRMVEDQAAEGGVTVVNQVRNDLPLLHSEPRALRQILLNLLSNAIKYTRSGGIVGVEATADDGRDLKIAIWDTGIGIPLEEQRKIFERNYRVPDEANHEMAGTGLGLAISLDLAHSIGGEIGVESKPGEGARFTLRLPLHVGEEGRMGVKQG